MAKTMLSTSALRYNIINVGPSIHLPSLSFSFHRQNIKSMILALHPGSVSPDKLATPRNCRGLWLMFKVNRTLAASCVGHRALIHLQSLGFLSIFLHIKYVPRISTQYVVAVLVEDKKQKQKIKTKNKT